MFNSREMTLKKKKNRGPKFKLNMTMINKLSESIAKGVPNKYACVLASITERSFYSYIEQAEALFDEKGGLIKPESELKASEKILIHLFHSIKRSKAEAVSRNVAMIQAAAINSWQAAAWWLERQDYEEFGRKEKGDKENPFVVAFSDETRKRLADIFNEAAIEENEA